MELESIVHTFFFEYQLLFFFLFKNKYKQKFQNQTSIKENHSYISFFYSNSPF